MVNIFILNQENRILPSNGLYITNNAFLCCLKQNINKTTQCETNKNALLMWIYQEFKKKSVLIS